MSENHALTICNAARALIIQNERLLVIKRKGVQGVFHLLPGGGQEHGETLPETLKREVLEEFGLDIEVGELLFVNEYISNKSMFASVEPNVHQVDFTFLCKLASDREAQMRVRRPGVNQIGISWIPLSEVIDYQLHPKGDLNFIMGAPTREALVDWLLRRQVPTYLGEGDEIK